MRSHEMVSWSALAVCGLAACGENGQPGRAAAGGGAPASKASSQPRKANATAEEVAEESRGDVDCPARIKSPPRDAKAPVDDVRRRAAGHDVRGSRERRAVHERPDGRAARLARLPDQDLRADAAAGLQRALRRSRASRRPRSRSCRRCRTTQSAAAAIASRRGHEARPVQVVRRRPWACRGRSA